MRSRCKYSLHTPFPPPLRYQRHDCLTNAKYPGTSTSAARFENGTTIPLAKIRGSAAYAALMEHLIPKPTTPHWLSYVGAVGRWLSLFRALKRSLGLAPTNESAVLAEMVAALKTASKTALQIQIEAVAVTAPWMAAWDNQVPADRVVKRCPFACGPWAVGPVGWCGGLPW